MVVASCLSEGVIFARNPQLVGQTFLSVSASEDSNRDRQECLSYYRRFLNVN